MMLLDEPPEPFLDDMGVDLGRGDIGVAEKLLHGAQIRAPLQQMAGEGMAEHMRGDARRLDPGAKQRAPLALGRNAAASDASAPFPEGNSHGEAGLPLRSSASIAAR